MYIAHWLAIYVSYATLVLWVELYPLSSVECLVCNACRGVECEAFPGVGHSMREVELPRVRTTALAFVMSSQSIFNLQV